MQIITVIAHGACVHVYSLSVTYLPPIYIHKFVSIRFWRRQTVSLESSPMDDTNEAGRGRDGLKNILQTCVKTRVLPIIIISMSYSIIF